MEIVKTKTYFNEHAANLCILLVKVIITIKNLCGLTVNGQVYAKKKKNSEEVLRTRTALLIQELPQQQITVKLKHVSISLYPHFAL